MREILAELDAPDMEHASTWLGHEDGWTLSVSEDGVAVWENEEFGHGPKYQEGIGQEEALRLWILVSLGEFNAVDSEPWKDGQGPPISEEELEVRRREIAEFTLKMNRDFYDSLGPEDDAKCCRDSDCSRGTVKFSVFCRTHHFESLRKESCPFDH
ncbi:hypothetical protein ACFFQ7_17600 [Roseibacillus persicicus]